MGSWGATELLDCLLRSIATARQRQVCRKGSKASLQLKSHSFRPEHHGWSFFLLILCHDCHGISVAEAGGTSGAGHPLLKQPLLQFALTVSTPVLKISKHRENTASLGIAPPSQQCFFSYF